MGLDISAYRKLTPSPDVAKDEEGNPVEWDAVLHVHPESLKWADEHFPGRSEGVRAGYFTYEDSDGFRAGSYSGYNVWRDMLARYAGYPSASHVHEQSDPGDGPFIELINFADNEGYIGPVVSAKLAKDFADHESAIIAKAEADGETWFIELYRKWRAAFAMAADGGCVEFH